VSVGIKADFEHEMREKMDTMAGKIASGQCKTYEEYRALCGELKGMRRTVEAFSEVYEKYITTDEDDEDDDE